MFKSVDLPAPDGPNIADKWPDIKCPDTFFRIGVFIESNGGK